MSVVSHIEHLQIKHEELEKLLSEEMHHPAPDFFVIKDMKKQKLLIKEEISRLTHEVEMRSRKDAS